MEDKIIRLFESIGLGEVVAPIQSVSGGFMHRMYRVDTKEQSYAMKCLNPEIMKRTEARENYRRAEELEKQLEDAGIPIVPALSLSGKKMQEFEGSFFYIFKWQEGKITEWDHITPTQCKMAGNIQGRIHAIAPKTVEKPEAEMCEIDWEKFIEEAYSQNSEIADLLKENKELLVYATEAVNKARLALPGMECIVDEDMDPKNVMWQDGKPVVIDLECLDIGNPVSSVIQLSLQWSGITTCKLDFDNLKAFFEGYWDAYDNGFRQYGDVFGLAYSWVEWLEYNVQRALGQCQDAKEQEMGISEVKNTVNRIRYFHDMEQEILECVKNCF